MYCIVKKQDRIPGKDSNGVRGNCVLLKSFLPVGRDNQMHYLQFHSKLQNVYKICVPVWRDRFGEKTIFILSEVFALSGVQPKTPEGLKSSFDTEFIGYWLKSAILFGLVAIREPY